MPEAAASTRPARARLLAVVSLLGLVALGLRAAGLHWGIPTADRYYPYHPDEPVLIVHVLQIDFAALQLSPHFFNYGSLYLYLCRLAIDVAAALGRLDPMPRDIAGWWPDLAAIFLLGRGVAAAMGALTVVVTGVLAARAFGKAAGVLAAAALAVAPLHVLHSHFVAVDVPATLWVALALWCAVRAVESPGRAWFAAAGAAAGLAAGTKYNAGLVLLAALAAVALAARRAEGGRRASVAVEGAFYALLAAAVAFVLATPGIVIDAATFRDNFNYERRHMGEGHGYVFVGTAPGWWFHVTDSLAPGLGGPLLIAAAAGLVWALRRREPADGVMLAFVVPYYLLIGSFQVKFARYTLPLFPPLCVWAGRAAAEWAGWRGGTGKQGAAPLAPAIRTAALIIGTYTLLYAMALDGVMLRPDTRTAAAAWLAARMRSGAVVALASPPWFYTPPLTPTLGWTHVLQRLEPLPPPADSRFVIPAGEALSPAELAGRRPQYVEISEFEERDAMRATKVTGQENPVYQLELALGSGYVPAAFFTSPPRLGPFTWFNIRRPPHDMLYIMPDVYIFERRRY